MVVDADCAPVIKRLHSFLLCQPTWYVTCVDSGGGRPWWGSSLPVAWVTSSPPSRPRSRRGQRWRYSDGGSAADLGEWCVTAVGISEDRLAAESQEGQSGPGTQHS